MLTVSHPELQNKMKSFRNLLPFPYFCALLFYSFCWHFQHWFEFFCSKIIAASLKITSFIPLNSLYFALHCFFEVFYKEAFDCFLQQQKNTQGQRDFQLYKKLYPRTVSVTDSFTPHSMFHCFSKVNTLITLFAMFCPLINAFQT